MTIKHLVIVGGGPNVFIHYGILKHLLQKSFIVKENIESIYATSCGCIASLILLLNLNYDDIDDYLINRPWEKLFAVKPQQLINSIGNMGLYDNIYYELFKPLLKINDLTVNITLKELYEFNKVEFNLFTTKYSTLESCCLNYKTFPDLKLLDAVYMSCTIPMLFKPMILDNELYLDGALLKNYPLKDCVDRNKDNQDEILGISQLKSEFIQENIEYKDLDLFKLITNVLGKLIFHINKENYVDTTIKNEIKFKIHTPDFNFWKQTLTSKEARSNLIQEGVDTAIDFLNKQ